MKFVSFNVAGIRSCLKKGFPEFFTRIDADIMALQEVKALESEIDFHPEGYQMYLNAAEKKGYSGTLIYSKIEPLKVTYGIGNPKFDREGRMITLEFNDFYFINVYVPNSKRELERLEERLEWEENIRAYLLKLKAKKSVILTGDFNVAHESIDIKNAKANEGNHGYTIEERTAFTELLNLGFIDTFRYLHPDTIKYSWWSYLFHAREKNAGWRLDYFLISEDLKERLVESELLNEVMGSDHCPIVLELRNLK